MTQSPYYCFRYCCATISAASFASVGYMWATAKTRGVRLPSRGKEYCGGGKKGSLQIPHQKGIRKGLEVAGGGTTNLGAADAEGAAIEVQGTRKLADKS